MYSFSQRSKEKLLTVDFSLRELMHKSIKDSPYDFGITEGLRSRERQKMLFDAGKSHTMFSKHLQGRAVDIAIFVEGRATWHFPHYMVVADHIKKQASLLGVKIVWGGEFKTLRDGVHFELL